MKCVQSQYLSCFRAAGCHVETVVLLSKLSESPKIGVTLNVKDLPLSSAETKATYENKIEKALALSANIVGMTCNRAAAYDFKDRTEMFDVAIIDEVCMATLPEILSPLVISRKAVLLGDPKQLPPVFCSEEQEIIRSIQNCNLNRFMYIDTLFNEGKKVSVLDTQYRMSNQIGCMISDLFYNGSLKNGWNEDVEDGLTWITYEPSNDWPIPTEELSDRPKIYNEDECKKS